jgi:hypothetical protein
MKIRNTTNIADKRLQEMIEFCDPGVSKRVHAIFAHSNDCARGYAAKKDRSIKVWVPKKQTYPYLWDFNHNLIWVKVGSDEEKRFSDGRAVVIKELKNHNSGRSISDWKLLQYEIRNPYRVSHMVLSKEEDMISVIAHELRHQWQYSKPLKSQWSYGCQKKSSHYTRERDASIYSITKLREWRRRNTPTEIYPDDRILRHGSD